MSLWKISIILPVTGKRDKSLLQRTKEKTKENEEMRINSIPVTNYRRGDVIYVKNITSKEAQGNHIIHGDRPAVIIQNQKGNEHSPNLIVAYLTSQLKRLEMKTHVPITWYEGLKPSMIQAEQLQTIDKGSVKGYITHLRDEDMVRLDRALIISLGLEQ